MRVCVCVVGGDHVKSSTERILTDREDREVDTGIM